MADTDFATDVQISALHTAVSTAINDLKNLPTGPAIVIAANNSSVEDKSIADVQCDGVNDEVQWQAAVDTGRPVIGCAGVFNISAPIALPSLAQVSGVGMYLTTLRNNGITTGDLGIFVSKTNTAVGVVIKEMNLDGAYGDCYGIRLRNTGRDAVDPPAFGNDNWSSIHDVYLDGFGSALGYHGIWLESANGTSRAYFLHNIGMREVSGHGLFLDGSTDNTVSNVHVGSSQDHGIVSNAANNRFTGCKSFYSNSNGIHNTGVRNTFAGCEVQDMAGKGFYSGGSNAVIAGLHVGAESEPRGCTVGFDVDASALSASSILVRIGNGDMDTGIKFTSGTRVNMSAVIDNVDADFDNAIGITGTPGAYSAVKITQNGADVYQPEITAAVSSAINALKAQSTITVDAGAVGSTARPTGWGHVQWKKNNGVVLTNLGTNDIVFERSA